MKLTARQIMEFRQAVDKVNLYYEDRVRESAPESEERRRLGNLVSAHQQLEWMADQLLAAEITVKG